MKLYEIIRSYVEDPLVSDFYVGEGDTLAMRRNGHVTRALSEEVPIQSIEGLLRDLGWTRDELARRDGDFDFTIDGRRGRGNFDTSKDGGDLSLRLFAINIPTLSDLKLPVKLYDWMKWSQGLILICGATGSGKSTTMASLLQSVNANPDVCRKIVTIEDPIEYVYPKGNAIIRQRAIDHDTGFFPHLKRALRQRPDIIALGELRDDKTAETCLQAAETGHLVISTLHADSVKQSIIRLLDMFPFADRHQMNMTLAFVLKGVIVQRLITGKDGTMRVAYEIAQVNTAISSVIRTGELQKIPNMLRQEGCSLLNDCLGKMVSEGFITSSVAKGYSYDPDSF